MQNNPPSNSEPEGSNDPTLSIKTNQDIPVTPSSISENVEKHPEPEYKEYAPPTYDRAAEQQSGLAVPGYPPSTPQPGYIPPTPQPGGGYYIPPTPQPGYIPPTPQPGYIPPTPQSGYTGQFPPTQPVYTGQFPPVQPGYTGQFPPVQPGYTGQFPPVQPGYPGPLQPGRPARRLSGLAITAIILVAIIVLGGAVAGIGALTRQPGTNNPTPITSSHPTVVPTATQPLGKPTSAFQTASCPFTLGSGIVEGQQVNCGYVTVPEDRNTSNGQTVKLAVAIFKATAYMNSVDPDPVLRLDGGPGGNSLDNLGVVITAANYNTFIFNHDVVMFDQRGTGFSTPSLDCPEIDNLNFSTTDVSVQTQVQAAQTCYNRLTTQGIDLNGFNSYQNADDVSDLIHALGYQQMTLYGVSYGTRLALTVMRLHPDVVHATILDSVYPPDHNRNDLPSDAQNVFNILFQGCAKDTSCNAKYPNLQTVFYNLVDALDAHPGKFNTTDPNTGKQYTNVELSGDDLINWLFSSFYVTSLIPLLPEIIYQVKNHQYQEFALIWAALIYSPGESTGMFYSTECAEDWPYLTQQDITQSEQGIDPHIVKVFATEDEELEYNTCQLWKVQTLPSVQKQPVVSSIPTLVLAGEYDPITPHALAQDAAKTLSHSYYFLFPGQGHGQEYSSDCSDEIITAFQANPDQQPSGDCISQMTEPQFQ